MRDDDGEDLVTWVLRAVCDRNPGVPLLEVEMEARRRWSGLRCYIAKRGHRERVEPQDKKGSARHAIVARSAFYAVSATV